MARLQILAKFILSYEGGFSDHPHDKGGATNKGVTLSTWKRVGYDKTGDGRIDVADLRLLTEEDAVERVMRPHYWNRCKGDRIESQSIANLLVDWVWGSGIHGIKNAQRLLGEKQDGIVGYRTLTALNTVPSESFFNEMMQARERFLQNIVKRDPRQRVFLRGWLRRLHSIGYGWLRWNGSDELTHFDEK